MTHPASNKLEGRPVIFGEVLFDLFPDSAAELGGAPFNVAWHLEGFGLRPLFISRVGRDENGRKVLERMREWGMDITGIQQDDRYPTGRVAVTFNGSQPGFNILPDQAYDHIDATRALHPLADRQYSMLYHGSLITRSSTAGKTLKKLNEMSLPVFFDVNLRPPWWEMKRVKKQLEAACWVKMNEEELVRISSGEGTVDDGLEEMARQLFVKYHLEALLITRGAQGAFLIVENERLVSSSPVKVNNLVDSVGAGDAFSAVMILAIIHKWPWTLALQRAGEFARQICRLRGATSAGPDVYRQYRQQWRMYD